MARAFFLPLKSSKASFSYHFQDLHNLTQCHCQPHCIHLSFFFIIIFIKA